MFARLTWPAFGFLLKDLGRSIRSPRLAVAALLFALVTLLIAWVLGGAAVSALESEREPSSLQLWERGADGALSTLAYILPVFIPIIPIVLARENLSVEAKGGFLLLSLSKPVPRAGIGGGKVAGLVGAIAVVLLPLSLASAFLIQAIVGAPVDPILVGAFVGSNMVLATLYLLLGLAIGTALEPSNIALLVFPLWVGFNVLRPTAFVMLGVLAGALRVEEVIVFEYLWTDVLTFTGTYQGLMAAFLPAQLGFVVWPPDSLLPQAVVWANAFWAVGLVVLFIVLLAKVWR